MIGPPANQILEDLYRVIRERDLAQAERDVLADQLHQALTERDQALAQIAILEHHLSPR